MRRAGGRGALEFIIYHLCANRLVVSLPSYVARVGMMLDVHARCFSAGMWMNVRGAGLYIWMQI